MEFAKDVWKYLEMKAWVLRSTYSKENLSFERRIKINLEYRVPLNNENAVIVSWKSLLQDLGTQEWILQMIWVDGFELRDMVRYLDES